MKIKICPFNIINSLNIYGELYLTKVLPLVLNKHNKILSIVYDNVQSIIDLIHYISKDLVQGMLNLYLEQNNLPTNNKSLKIFINDLCYKNIIDIAYNKTLLNMMKSYININSSTILYEFYKKYLQSSYNFDYITNINGIIAMSFNKKFFLQEFYIDFSAHKKSALNRIILYYKDENNEKNIITNFEYNNNDNIKNVDDLIIECDYYFNDKYHKIIESNNEKLLYYDKEIFLYL